MKKLAYLLLPLVLVVGGCEGGKTTTTILIEQNGGWILHCKGDVKIKLRVYSPYEWVSPPESHKNLYVNPPTRIKAEVPGDPEFDVFYVNGFVEKNAGGIFEALLIDEKGKTVRNFTLHVCP